MKHIKLRGIALNRSHLFNALRQLLLFAEIIVLTLMLLYTWERFYNAQMPVPIFFRGYYPLAIFYAAVLFISLKALRGLSIGDTRLFDTIVSQSLALSMCNVVFYFPLSLISYRILNPTELILMTLVQLAVILWWCFLCNRLFVFLFRPREMLLICDDVAGSEQGRKMAAHWDQYHVCASISAHAAREDIQEAMLRCHAVLLETGDGQVQDWVAMECFRRNLFLFFVPTLENIILHSARRTHIVDTPLLRTDSHRITTFDLFLKRCMDIFVSALGLLVLSPLLLLIALSIRLGDGGSVFFRQERLTQDGKAFRLVKFRTMVEDAEKEGPCLARADDERITRVGAVLRRSRLDELPQLWNVLRGDMSLVGPRPERPELAAEYEKALPEFAYRLKVKAGITGMAQVYGNYATSPRDKLLMDVMYIEEYTFSLDVKLLLLTLRTLFLTEKSRGVEETEEEEKV